MTTTEITEAPVTTISPSTLCDQCGSAYALVCAVSPAGSKLELCGHHADANAVTLVAAGWTLTDTR
jgi:hypothetical protein